MTKIKNQKKRSEPDQLYVTLESTNGKQYIMGNNGTITVGGPADGDCMTKVLQTRAAFRAFVAAMVTILGLKIIDAQGVCESENDSAAPKINS